MNYTVLFDYWGVIAVPLTAIVSYIFGGKIRQALENKRAVEETKIQSATALEGMQSVYDKYIEHDKLRTEKLEVRIELLETHNREIQSQFNNLQLSYAIVIEQSKDWENKHKLLSKEYETLKKAHDSLQKDFESYKKQNKIIEQPR